MWRVMNWFTICRHLPLKSGHDFLLKIYELSLIGSHGELSHIIESKLYHKHFINPDGDDGDDA